jgi:Sulfotransferase domain
VSPSRKFTGLSSSRRRQASRLLAASRARGHSWVRRLTLQQQDGGVLSPGPPPPCPPGWTTAPPDFVGIGAQRAGTTRWFDLIAAHPEVVPPGAAAKELHYFDRYHAADFGAADAAGYAEHFPRDGGRKAGEWTPLYMAAPWIPPLLAASAPSARLLVLLRDPVERYLSGLQHDTHLARDQGQPLSQLAPVEAFARGFYHAQLRRLLNHFERSQVLVLQYERCTEEPLRELHRTFEFIGLDPGFVPDLESHHPNRQHSKPTLPADRRDAYVRAYSEDVTALSGDFPEIDLRLWPNFAHLAG